MHTLLWVIGLWSILSVFIVAFLRGAAEPIGDDGIAEHPAVQPSAADAPMGAVMSPTH